MRNYIIIEYHVNYTSKNTTVINIQSCIDDEYVKTYMSITNIMHDHTYIYGIVSASSIYLFIYLHSISSPSGYMID